MDESPELLLLDSKLSQQHHRSRQKEREGEENSTAGTVGQTRSGTMTSLVQFVKSELHTRFKRWPCWNPLEIEKDRPGLLEDVPILAY
jgi:hypothetical protein